MTQQELPFMPRFFDRYILQVEENDHLQALEVSLQRLKMLDLAPYQQLGSKVYSPEKWTIADIFQHMCDTERILAYRALRFARNDKRELQGFDEELYAQNTTAANRPLNEILYELILIRESSLLLFKNFSKEMLLRISVANGVELSVLSLGFIIPGHQNHHFRVMQERYLPLLSV